jgi:membrane protease YdiL (CAAX protease family)
MPKRSSPSVFWEEGYLHLTHRPLNCLVFILPPLAVYQLYALRYGTQLLAPRDLARLLRYFGATAGVLPPLLILVVLLGQHLFHSNPKYPWRIDLGALAGMLVESVLWVLPLLGLSHLIAPLLAAALTGPPSALTQGVIQGLGAGIYEEFIFRLVLLSVVMAILVDLLGVRRTVGAVVAVLLGAALFSLYHFSRQQVLGELSFPWGVFAFRLLAGVYLGGLYVCRGFGIAVGTHAAWNIWVSFVGS